MAINQKKGISWTFLSTVTGAILQTLQLAITVRYLETAEIGIIAIVNVLLAIANMLKDFGLSSFLVHKQDISHKQQSGLFWLTIAIGSLIGVLVATIAKPIAWFYSMPQLDYLLYLSAINIVVIASCSQWQALMLKQFKFTRIAQIELIAKVFAFLATIVFLELGYGLYSPVLAMLTANIINFGLLYLYNRNHFIPSLYWDKTMAQQAFSYGLFQVGGQFLNQLRANLDTLLLGKFLGAESVGVYSLAKELILRPARLIQPVVSRFALPNFAMIQKDRVKQGELYIKTATILVAINSLVYASLLLLASPVTQLLYGADISNQIVIFLQVLTVFGFVRCIGGPMGSIAQANGRTELEFRWNVISTILFGGILLFSTQHSVLLTTISMSIGQVIMTNLSFFLFLKPLCDVSYRRFILLSLPTTILLSFQMITLHVFNSLSAYQYMMLISALFCLLLLLERRSYKLVIDMLRKS